MNIRQVAKLIGLSVWSIRYRLIPSGLPYFRSGPSGKMIFYRDQITAWLQKKQGGNIR